MAFLTPGTGDIYTTYLNMALKDGHASPWAIYAGATAITLDCDQYVHFRLNFSAAWAANLSITNADDGQEIEILFNVGNYAVTPTWVPAMTWREGRSLTPIRNGQTLVRLKYDSGLAKWIELWRSTSAAEAMTWNQGYTAGTSSPALNVAAHSILRLNFASAGTCTPTFTGATANRIVRLLCNTGAYDVTLSNALVVFKGGTDPTLPQSRTSALTLLYDAELTKWIELSRSF